MKLIEISECSIRGSRVSVEETGEIYQTRSGNTKRKGVFKRIYETGIGKFYPSDWMDMALQVIECIGENDLLDEIKKYAKENCVWLKTDKDIQEHSVRCLLSQAYMYWEKFGHKRIPEHKIFYFEF